MTFATLVPIFAPSSILSLTVMFVILAGATWVFTTLVARETKHRFELTLADWAATRGLRMVDVENHSPGQLVIPALGGVHPKFEKFFYSARCRIAQLRTDDPPQIKAAAPTWNLLVLHLDCKWAPTGLRPAERPISILDLFSLSSFASLAPNLKFMVFGAEPAAARALPASAIAAILPPDVGFLLHGSDMILDFTAREFDEIELSRIMDLAAELAQLLTPATAGKTDPGGLHAI